MSRIDYDIKMMHLLLHKFKKDRRPTDRTNMNECLAFMYSLDTSENILL